VNKHFLKALLILVGLLLLPLMTVAAQGAETQTQLSQPLFSLTIGEALGALMGTLAFLLAAGKILWDWAQGRIRNPDAAMTERLQTAQKDREWIGHMEKVYERADTYMNKALDATVSVLKVIAPLTSRISVDDAVLKLLQDIQKPGAPELIPVPVPVAVMPSPGGDAATSEAGSAG
jgi:hypothetical protein